MIHSPWIRWSFLLLESPWVNHHSITILGGILFLFLLVPRHLKQIHHSPISGKKETRFPMVPSHSGNSRNSITFRRDLWHLPWDSPVKLQGHLWRGHPKVGKYTGSDVSQERKKRDLARKVQAPKRENQKTRTPFAVVALSRFRAFMCSMLAFSRFRVLPAAPPRPDTHFVCTGCFRVPNIYAKGRFEFLLFFWLPSFAVLGASFEECFFACFFSLGGGKPSEEKNKAKQQETLSD